MKRIDWQAIALFLILGAIFYWLLGLRSASADIKPYIAVGQADFKLVGSGVWFIDELPHTVKNKPLAWSIGLSANSWKTGYVNLGSVKSDALAYYPDSAYQPGAPKGCASLGCAPTNRYLGKFAVDGLFATYEPHIGIFTVGAGPVLLRHRYRESITVSGGFNPYLGTNQQSNHFDYDFHTEWRMTYLLTAGVNGKHLFADIQLYPNALGSNGIFKGITIIFVGYKF